MDKPKRYDIPENSAVATAAEEQLFYRLFKKWWEKTCIYSGPGLCYRNDEFRRIHQMGTSR